MDAVERDAQARDPGETEPAAIEPAQVTLTLPAGAVDALGNYLRDGGARGLPFERALLTAIARAPQHPATARVPITQRTLRAVHAFVEANLHRDIGVADIAHAVFLSPDHLGHSFRRATGQSLWQFVLQRRAERARRLIDAQPASTLADISVLCGFESYSQFIAAFRKSHGVTPGSYRRARGGAAE